jgi:diguanylate cyclase (GGDEF)-like protein
MIESENVPRKAEIGSVATEQYRGQWLLLGLALLLLLGALDYMTGFRLRFTVLYLLPLLIFTWVLGRFLGVLLSVITVTAEAYIDVLSERYFDHPQLLYWDWGVVLLGYALVVFGLTELRRSLYEARFLSRKDSLTGLVNKGGFYQVVSAEMEQCRRYARTLSIAYIDCDNFKQVNDRFGHAVGDTLLRAIANIMLRKLRGSDLPGRLGGDEFAVMLPETSAEACHMVIESLQKRLDQEMQTNGWPVTFSIGIATFIRMPASIDNMISQADKLMYEVKNSSKGAIKQEVFGG